MAERDKVHARVRADIRARLDQYVEDQAANHSQAIEELLDDALRRRGYSNGDRPPARARWTAKIGEILLYFAAAVLLVLLMGSTFDPELVTIATAAIIVGVVTYLGGQIWAGNGLTVAGRTVFKRGDRA